jgi:hypothetical protein
MDVLVMLEEDPSHSPVLAHVNSAPAPLGSHRTSRDVVTLYGDPTAESLALALAAAVESRRSPGARDDAIWHLGVWPERGAVGDAAWRDEVTGQLMTRDLDIPFATLLGTAQALLGECGQAIRRMLAGLRMPDWPEGTRRSLLVSFHPAFAAPMLGEGSGDSLLAAFREADGITFDGEGD